MRRSDIMVQVMPLAMACLLLSACNIPKDDWTSTSDTMPAAFGAVSRTLLGCPNLQGAYAWPPVEGAFAEGKSRTDPSLLDHGQPFFSDFRTNFRDGVYQRRQIWITQDSRHLTVRTRSGVVTQEELDRAQSNGRKNFKEAWSETTYEIGDFSCFYGGMSSEPKPVETKQKYGRDAHKRGYKLLRLKDGSLALGIESVATGRTASLFSWGEHSYGSLRLPDKSYWDWSKLERIGSGEREPELWIVSGGRQR